MTTTLVYRPDNSNGYVAILAFTLAAAMSQASCKTPAAMDLADASHDASDDSQIPLDLGDSSDAATTAEGGTAPDLGGSDASSAMDAGYDAGLPEPCKSPGSTEERPCGTRCGVSQQECQSSSGRWVWVHVGACMQEGVCEPGTTDSRMTLGCGTEIATCTSQCVWGTYQQNLPDVAAPQCQYGETRVVDALGCDGRLTRRERCTEQCQWSGQTSECGGGCPGVRRTLPIDREEVCVPAGMVRTGDIRAGYAEQDAWLSSYYMDRYPVSYRRYVECMNVGACPYLDLPPEATSNPDLIMWEATFDAARSFCRWDGNRQLPSTAQWEKAFKGPAPSVLRNAWEPAVLTCLDIPARYLGCTNNVPDFTERAWDVFGAYPKTESIYGVRMMFASFNEWTSDFYRQIRTEEELSATLPIDPVVVIRQNSGLLGFEGYALMGIPRTDAVTRGSVQFSSRDARYGGYVGQAAIRCIRPAR